MAKAKPARRIPRPDELTGVVRPLDFRASKPLPPAGWTDAVLVDWTPWDSPHKAFSFPRVRLTYQLAVRKPNGYRWTWSRIFSRTVGPKAQLRAWLEKWQAMPFTPEQDRYGVNLEDWIGRPCQLLVEYAERETASVVSRPILADIAAFPEDAKRQPLTPEPYERGRRWRGWMEREGGWA